MGKWIGIRLDYLFRPPSDVSDQGSTYVETRYHFFKWGYTCGDPTGSLSAFIIDYRGSWYRGILHRLHTYAPIGTKGLSGKHPSMM